MKILKILLTLTSVFFIIGCSNTTPQLVKKKKELPLWYTSPSNKNTAQFNYSIGIGITKDESITNALAEIISHFSISIESTFESNKSFKNGTYRKDIIKKLKSQISKVKINNYEILNSYRIQYNKYITEIKVDKIKLGNHLKLNLKNEFDKFNIEEKSVENENVLIKLNTYKQLSQKSEESNSKIYIISSIDPYFNDTKYQKLINHYQKKYLYYKHNASISIKNYDKNDNFFNALKTFITNNHIKIENRKDMNIHLISRRRIVNNGYFNIIVFSINVKTFFKNKLIGNKTIEIKEHNKGDSQRVEEKASQRFLNELNNTIINDFIYTK